MQEVYCLQDPCVLKTVKLERYDNIRDGKKQLYESDFILSILPLMQPVAQRVKFAQVNLD